MMIAPLNLPTRMMRLTLPPPGLNTRLAQLLLVVVLIILGLVMAWLPLPQVILLLGGAIFLAVLLIEPLLGLLLLIPIIPFSPLFALSGGRVKMGLMETVLILTVIAWLLKFSTGQIPPHQDSPPQRRALLPGRAVLLLPFLFFLGGAGLSWVKALSIGASLVETIKWVEMLLLYLFVVTLLPVRYVKWVVGLILLTGMAQAALGLYQFIFKVGPEGFLLFGGRFLRAYGTFAQPNPYGGYLGLILPLALALALWGFTDFKLQMPARPVSGGLVTIVLFGLPLGLLLAALFATQSRSAWLGFGVAAVVVLMINSKKTAALVASIVLVAAIFALIGAFEVGVAKINATYGVVFQRLVDAASIFTITDISTIEVTDANFATIERLAHWQAARAMWRDNPWLGTGFGNYAVVYPAYALGRWLDPLGHAHNYLLNLGAEVGLIGLIAYLIFWIFSFGVLWQAVRRNHGFERAVAVGGFGIIVHLHIHNLFDNLYVQGMYLHLAIILAVVSVIYQGRQIEEKLTNVGNHLQSLPNQTKGTNSLR